MSKKKTLEEFRNEISQYSDYIVFNYTNNKEKSEFLHKACNKRFFMRPSDFLKNHRCPYCAGHMRKTIENFLEEVKEKVGDEYEVLDKIYKNNKEPMRFLHKKCGKISILSPHSFLKGGRCKFCNFKYLDNDILSKRIGNNFEIISNYNSKLKKILLKHKACNREFEISKGTFLNSKNILCPFCSKYYKKTIENCRDEVKELEGDEYIILSKEYINNKTKMEYYHKKCGRSFFMRHNNFLLGQRCPFCKESKGIKKIVSVLHDNGINEITFEKQFEGCYGDKRPLKFDIYLGKLNVLIEYDGEFHSENIFGSKYLKRQQRYDKIKDNFCKKNNIPLLRVSYLQYNDIEKIIMKFLNFNKEI